MKLGLWRLLTFISEQQQLVPAQEARRVGAFDLYSLHRHAALQQRQGQSVKRTQIGVRRIRVSPLKHHRVGNQHARIRSARILPAHIGLFHLAQSRNHGLQARSHTASECRHARRSEFAAPKPPSPVPIGACSCSATDFSGADAPDRMTAIEDPVRPRHDLVVPDFGLQQRGCQACSPNWCGNRSNRDWDCLRSDRLDTKRAGPKRAPGSASRRIPGTPFRTFAPCVVPS